MKSHEKKKPFSHTDEYAKLGCQMFKAELKSLAEDRKLQKKIHQRHDWQNYTR